MGPPGLRWARWRGLPPLFAVLALAAFLRLYRLDLASFKGDDAMVLSLALGIVQGTHFPLTGIPSSVGLPNPPLFSYLIALPIFVRRDVLAPIVFVALANVAAVGLTYLLVRRYFRWSAAAVAALLYAVGFWPVVFSRFIWAQNLLPLFTALTGLCLFEAVVGKRRWFFALAALFAGLAAQVHFSALASLPMLALAALLFRRRLGPAIALGGVLLALTLAPYLYQDLRRGGSAVEHIVELVQRPGRWERWAWIYPARLLGHLEYQAWLGDAEEQIAATSVDVRWSSWIEGGLLGLGVLYVTVRALARPREGEDAARYGLLALWALVPVLLFTYPSYPLYEHYFIAQYPAVFAIVGVTAGDGVRWLQRRIEAWRIATWTAGALAGLALAAVSGAQLHFNLVSLDYLAQGQAAAARGVLLRPLQEALAETARVREATRASQVWIMVPGDPSQVGSLGHLFDPLGRLRLGAQTLGGAHTLVWRAGPAPQVYLSARQSGPADRFLRQDLAAIPLSTIEDLRGVPFVDVFSVTPEELQRAVQRTFSPLDRGSTVGVRLLGYTFDPEVALGGTLSVAVWWKVEDTTRLAPPAQERFFVHVAPGPHAPQVAQEDALGYGNARWSLGDSVVSWFSIPIPPTAAPGDYFIRVGLYELLTLARAPFLDEQGLPETDYLLFGPVRIAR